VIPLVDILPPDNSWQRQLRDAIDSPEELLQRLSLAPEQLLDHAAEAARHFPVKVPAAFLQRMQPGNPEDPLLLQVMSTAEELQDAPGYTRDPVCETGEANPSSGIIHKYRGRVLLIASSACAIHCRYCFRRHFPYDHNRNSRQEWQQALRFIASDREITEVILSGGDPLTITDSHLSELVDLVAAIPRVKRLRIHTRLPVVIPDRVTEGLLNALDRKRLQVIVVIHANHPNEIDAAVASAMQRMRERGITLLNQSVLLAGVNDNVDALATLSERLFEAGVLPYYLHLLDKVQGAAHFDTDEARAGNLIAQLCARLPGYLVPRLVREVAGAESKVPVATPSAY
jgi:EF-P beta-lysylation protein EpmB